MMLRAFGPHIDIYSVFCSPHLPLPPVAGEVVFQGIDFRFSEGAPQVVKNVSFHVPAGAFVGIVGRSGSGKSTIMKLLPRLYEPEAGRILIDGYDLSKLQLGSVRRQIGIVPQDSLLFDGSVRDNIALNALSLRPPLKPFLVPDFLIYLGANSEN